MRFFIKTILAVVIIIVSACGRVGSSGDDLSSLGKCAGASSTEFIVEWNDGRYTVEKSTSLDDFKKNFVEEKKNEIRNFNADMPVQLISPRESDMFESEASEKRFLASAFASSWGVDRIHAPQVWNKGAEGSQVIVGVVDGYVDVNHNQLKDNIYVNQSEIPGNNVDDDGNGFVDDYKGVKINSEPSNPNINQHGTHVAGIVAANGLFGPVMGVAPKAKVLPVQFINDSGAGTLGNAIIALNYLAKSGAKIINMSWAMPVCQNLPTLKSALQQLNDKGILLITASGNADSGKNTVNIDDYPLFPSAYNFSNQINVGSIGQGDFYSTFAHYGEIAVHVAAPGENIFSTIPLDGAKSMSGTSMAAPMVAGAAALLWGAFPQATATQIKKAILNSVDKNNFFTLPVATHGIVNVESAYYLLKAELSK